MSGMDEGEGEGNCTSRKDGKLTGIIRISKSHMGNGPSLKKGMWPDPLGAVNALRGKDKVAWGQFLSETPDGREGQDDLDTQMLERSNVGAVGHLGGVEGMVQAVAGDKGHAGPLGLGTGDGDGRGGGAPGGHHLQGLQSLKTWEAIQPCSTNNSNVHWVDRFGHG